MPRTWLALKTLHLNQKEMKSEEDLSSRNEELTGRKGEKSSTYKF